MAHILSIELTAGNVLSVGNGVKFEVPPRGGKEGRSGEGKVASIVPGSGDWFMINLEKGGVITEEHIKEIIK